MKLKGFTIAESMMVLVLTGILFLVILNAHQIINSVYALNVRNSKSIEAVVEVQKILNYEAFQCDHMMVEDNRILFEYENKLVTVEPLDSSVLVTYDRTAAEIKEMLFDVPLLIVSTNENKQGSATRIVMQLNYTDEWHEIEINKNYTSKQLLERQRYR